jgi:hypothetical protein
MPNNCYALAGSDRQVDAFEEAPPRLDGCYREIPHLNANPRA